MEIKIKKAVKIGIEYERGWNNWIIVSILCFELTFSFNRKENIV